MTKEWYSNKNSDENLVIGNRQDIQEVKNAYEAYENMIHTL